MEAGEAAPPDLSVVSPVYGCVDCLEDLVERIDSAVTATGLTHEVILVDDASPDGAWSRIRELAALHPHLRGLRLSRNFGQHAAISAGLEVCRGGKVVVMDCDLQDRPEEIPGLLESMQPGIDVVLAMRVSRQDNWLKRTGSRLFYSLLGWLADSQYDHTTANFGVYSRKVVDAVNAMPEADRFFPLLVRWVGFTVHRVPVTHGRREQGKSTYSLRKLVSLAMGVALSFSDKPLRLMVGFGFAFCAFSMVVVLLTVVSYLDGDIAVAGYASIIASIWLVGGIVTMGLGVLGHYVGRIFRQVKLRPNYLVAERTPRLP